MVAHILQPSLYNRPDQVDAITTRDKDLRRSSHPGELHERETEFVGIAGLLAVIG